MRTPRPKKEIPLEIPAPLTDIKPWLVVGIDPSLSRTGFAMAQVLPAGELTGHNWLRIGSVKPDSSQDPIWVRGKAMALYLKQQILSVYGEINPPRHDPNCPTCHGTGCAEQGDQNEECGCLLGTFERPGLIISMEYPTPMNDFLVALNRIIHLVFFDTGCSPDADLSVKFNAIRILTTNASTLRSLMGLHMRGTQNKKENIRRAYEFVDQKLWPSLDTDSCDAILLAEMGKYAAEIMVGHDYNVPERFKNALCNSTKEVKGKGTRVRIIAKGLLHRDEYWYPYERKECTLRVKDAANPKPGLTREQFLL